MEILNRNLLDTITALTVGSSTDLKESVLVRDSRFKYVTEGAANDSVGHLFRVTFSSQEVVSRIALVGINWKRFLVSYDTATTANAFNLTSTGATTVTDFSTNSEGSIYLSFTPQTCSSIHFNAISTQVANEEKEIGYLVISRVLSSFGNRNPDVSNFELSENRKQRLHRLSTGGVTGQVFDRRYSAELAIHNVDASTSTELLSLFEDREDFIFCPFGTTTGWDAVIFPTFWENRFDFHTFTDNANAKNTSGRIRLLETRPG